MHSKRITLYADRDNERILLKTKSQKKNMYDYSTYRLPKDPQYWRDSGHGGIYHVRDFLQTPRGEEWLIDTIEMFASEYDINFETPESFEDVEIWR